MWNRLKSRSSMTPNVPLLANIRLLKSVRPLWNADNVACRSKGPLVRKPGPTGSVTIAAEAASLTIPSKVTGSMGCLRPRKLMLPLNGPARALLGSMVDRADTGTAG